MALPRETEVTGRITAHNPMALFTGRGVAHLAPDRTAAMVGECPPAWRDREGGAKVMTIGMKIKGGGKAVYEHKKMCQALRRGGLEYQAHHRYGEDLIIAAESIGEVSPKTAPSDAWTSWEVGEDGHFTWEVAEEHGETTARRAVLLLPFREAPWNDRTKMQVAMVGTNQELVTVHGHQNNRTIKTQNLANALQEAAGMLEGGEEKFGPNLSKHSSGITISEMVTTGVFGVEIGPGYMGGTGSGGKPAEGQFTVELTGQKATPELVGELKRILLKVKVSKQACTTVIADPCLGWDEENSAWTETGATGVRIVTDSIWTTRSMIAEAVMEKTKVIPAFVLAPVAKGSHAYTKNTVKGATSNKKAIQFLIVMPNSEKGVAAAATLLEGPLNLRDRGATVIPAKAMVSCEIIPVNDRNRSKKWEWKAGGTRPWDTSGWEADAGMMSIDGDNAMVWVPPAAAKEEEVRSPAAIAAENAAKNNLSEKQLTSLAVEEAKDAALVANSAAATYMANQALKEATAAVVAAAPEQQREAMQAAMGPREALAVVEITTANETLPGPGDGDFTLRVTSSMEMISVKEAVRTAMEDKDFKQAVGLETGSIWVAMATAGGEKIKKMTAAGSADGSLVRECKGWTIQGDDEAVGDVRLIVMGPEYRGAAKGVSAQKFREATAKEWAQGLPAVTRGAKRAASAVRTSPRKRSKPGSPNEASSGNQEAPNYSPAPPPKGVGSPTGLSEGLGGAQISANSTGSKRNLTEPQSNSALLKRKKKGEGKQKTKQGVGEGKMSEEEDN